LRTFSKISEKFNNFFATSIQRSVFTTEIKIASSLERFSLVRLSKIKINVVCFFDTLIAASGGGGSMLVPPVAQSGTGDRPVGDTVARAQQTTGPTAATTTLWPLAPAPPHQVPNQQSQGIPPLAATPTPAHNQGSHYIICINHHYYLAAA